MKATTATEHEEQATVVQYCRLRNIACFAIPNGTFLAGNSQRRAGQMRKLKAEGLKEGVPDLFIPKPSNIYSGLFIEMKRVKGSKTTAEQIAWNKYLNDEGYYAKICKGSGEAIKIIREYIKG